MELFSITCTTCQRTLRVRDAAAIGQILACPKCGSMVRVEPPPNWNLEAAMAAQTPNAAGPALTASQTFPPINPNAAVEPVAPSAAPPAPSAAEIERPPRVLDVPPEEAAGEMMGTRGASPWKTLAIASSCGAAAAVVVAIVAWGLSAPRVKVEAPNAVAAATPSINPPSSTDPPPRGDTLATEAVSTERWLPREARVLFRARFAELPDGDDPPIVVPPSLARWSRGARDLIADLELPIEHIDRVWLAFAGPDVARSAAEAVTILDFTTAPSEWLASLSDEASPAARVAGRDVYRLPSKSGVEAALVAGETTLVFGPWSALERLDGSSPLDQPALERVVAEAADSADYLLAADWKSLAALDLGPARLVLADLGARRDDWNELAALPVAASIEITARPRFALRARIACDAPSSAERVKTILGESLRDMAATFTAEKSALVERLSAMARNDGAAEVTNTLDAAAALAASTEVAADGDMVRLSAQGADTSDTLAEWLRAAGDPFVAHWMGIVSGHGERRLTELLAGVEGVRRDEGSYPAGAGGAALLPAETRISWIGTLLPYYGLNDWHRQLNFARAWNDPSNAAISRQPLPLTLNPGLPRTMTEAGFPVTHYVGLAGVGADAGSLEASHPRAGVFGFGRRAIGEMITDGLSNTIALIGVSDQLGAWASGGSATVRGLSQQPYVNGPDGFGSGQPNGMLVCMADGSVRFVSSDIDPSVLEGLATIHGGEPVVAAPPLASLTLRGEPRGEAAPNGAPTAEADAPAAIEATALPSAPMDVIAPAVVDVARPPLPAVDVEARLSATIDELTIDRLTLVDLADFFTQLAAVEMTLDLEGLADAGLTAQDTLAGRAPGGAIGDSLRAILATRGLTFVVVGNAAVITDGRPGRDQRSRRSYVAGDYGSEDPQELAGLLRRLIEQATWSEAGGRGAITLEAGKLVIDQTASVHARIARFAHRLRMARESALLGGDDRARAFATPWTLARQSLEKRVTANFSTGETLARVARYLAAQNGLSLVFDVPSLEAIGLSPTELVQFSANDEPLDAALGQLLTPLGLTFAPFDGGTLLVTSRSAADERTSIEFHRIDSPAADGTHAAAWIDRVQAQIAPRSWRDAGGRGDIVYDTASRSFIVLQTSANHAELERLIEAWTAERDQ